MTNAKSRIFFPLRSNARSLVHGAPVNSVRRRIKMAALLYDEVLVEEGVWHVSAGPTGSISEWRPGTGQYQTARDRGTSKGKSFQLTWQTTDAPPNSPSAVVVESLATISWRATFEPLKTEIPKAYQWLCFGLITETPEIEKAIDDWTNQDESGPLLRGILPELFVRNIVIKDANTDLLHGAQLGAATSMDSFHAIVHEARLQSGDARPAFGVKALSVILPDAGDLSWEEIEQLRRHSGLSDFRHVIAEIEAEAWEKAASLDDFENTIHANYQKRLREAQESASSGFRGKLAVTSVGLLVGEIVGALAGVPLVGGLIGETVGFVAQRAVSNKKNARWLSADIALDRRIRTLGKDAN